MHRGFVVGDGLRLGRSLVTGTRSGPKAGARESPKSKLLAHFSLRRRSSVLFVTVRVSAMEVASPLTIAPGAAGTKRPLSCSPGLMERPANASEEQQLTRAFKRRRFNSTEAVESLSEKFSSHSPFSTAFGSYGNGKRSSAGKYSSLFSRHRGRCSAAAADWSDSCRYDIFTDQTVPDGRGTLDGFRT